MIFDALLLNLLLYCAQQLGIALGLGAQTIMLVAYISAMRDGVVDEREAQFLRATRRTLWFAFSLIVVSGVSITLMHVFAGQGLTTLTPAYLFKTFLIIIAIALTALVRTLPETVAEGLLGGTWYALFLVHILAPITSWDSLFIMFGVWLAGFNFVWYAVVFTTRERAAQTEAPKPKPVPVKIPTPVVSAPVVPIEIPTQFQPIKIDPVPAAAPIVLPQTVRMETIKIAPAPAIVVQAPIPVSPAPLSQVKVEPVQAPAPTAFPVEKMPGTIATDTPFLPQVPPLQPIPVIIPATAAPIPSALPTTPVTPNNPLVAQQGQVPATPTTAPEANLGLNIMPKSPDQLK